MDLLTSPCPKPYTVFTSQTECNQEAAARGDDVFEAASIRVLEDSIREALASVCLLGNFYTSGSALRMKPASKWSMFGGCEDMEKTGDWRGSGESTLQIWKSDLLVAVNVTVKPRRHGFRRHDLSFTLEAGSAEVRAALAWDEAPATCNEVSGLRFQPSCLNVTMNRRG